MRNLGNVVDGSQLHPCARCHPGQSACRVGLVKGIIGEAATVEELPDRIEDKAPTDPGYEGLVSPQMRSEDQSNPTTPQHPAQLGQELQRFLGVLDGIHRNDDIKRLPSKW